MPGGCQDRFSPRAPPPSRAPTLNSGHADRAGAARDPRLSGVQDRVEAVKDGPGLRCAKCRRVYTVQDDIPVMLVDEAKIEE